MRCPFFRWAISHAADSDRPIGRLTRRHMARCPTCRHFHRSCCVLADGLRREAATVTQGGRHTLADAIADKPRPRRPFTGSELAAAACVTLAVLAGLHLTRWQTRPSREPAAPVHAVALTGPDLASTWSRVVETPLAVEARYLMTDAESGLRLLVACLNVTPSGDTAAP